MVSRRFDARRIDASAAWAEALRGDGPARDEAVFWLRAHLAGAATFALRRLGVLRDGGQGAKSASLARDATEAALAAVLADLDRYREQSAFTTWTAKYAIHEAAAAARRDGIASPSSAEL